MSASAYSFTVLRYVHDSSTDEFLNVGVVLYSPCVPYIRAKIQPEYSRLSTAFDGFHGEYYRSLVRHVESRINRLSDRWSSELRFEDLPSDARLAASLILPRDDSSLQFSEPYGGLADDLDEKLEELYHWYVARNQAPHRREGRPHEEVWRTFKHHLSEQKVLPRLIPVSIHGASFDYEFEHAWKNEKWHPLEAVSMDAVEAHTLQDRATRWVGRATDLQSDERLGKIHLLVGPPQLERLHAPYMKALDLLHKMPVDHEIVLEDGAADFARELHRQMRRYEDEEQ